MGDETGMSYSGEVPNCSTYRTFSIVSSIFLNEMTHFYTRDPQDESIFLQCPRSRTAVLKWRTTIRSQKRRNRSDNVPWPVDE